MFFYNARAIVFGIAGLHIAVLFGIGLFSSPGSLWLRTTLVLSCAWLIAIGTTLLLHRDLLKRLEAESIRNELPRAFHRYFLIDFILLLSLILVGQKLQIPLQSFALLLFAEIVVYGAFIGGGSPVNPISLVLPVLVLVTIAVRLFRAAPLTTHDSLLDAILLVAPAMATFVITISCVLVISLLRRAQHLLSQELLTQLGACEGLLARVFGMTGSESTKSALRTNIQAVLEQITAALEPSLFHGACLWLLERHTEYGYVIAPFAWTGCNGNERRLPYIKLTSGRFDPSRPPTPAALDAIAAVTMAHPEGRNVRSATLLGEHGWSGILLSHGRGSWPIDKEEARRFLDSVAAAMAHSIDAWAYSSHEHALSEMDSLFECSTLDELFPKANSLLDRHLNARATMITFRAKPTDRLLRVVAIKGLSQTALTDHYAIDDGSLTSKCASAGITMRADDVAGHRMRFSEIHLKRLELWHAAPVRSWMAIPIGGSGQNLGVIKVINSLNTYGWFNTTDQQLGKELALRLRVIIERIQFLSETEEARRESESQARAAVLARRAAEQTATKLQEDLVTITHQLQGPIVSIIGSLSALRIAGKPDPGAIAHAQALAEDALTVCYGTTCVLASEAGKEIAFTKAPVDAMREVRALCARLQTTTPRADLRYEFLQDSAFPTWHIDKGLFTCVLYSLIHNAMKYSEPGGRVIFECGFELLGHRPAIKVKSYGARIDNDERELVFEKYKRGRVVEGTGRHHHGVGLGLWVARTLMRTMGGDIWLEPAHGEPKLAIFVIAYL